MLSNKTQSVHQYVSTFFDFPDYCPVGLRENPVICPVKQTWWAFSLWYIAMFYSFTGAFWYINWNYYSNVHSKNEGEVVETYRIDLLLSWDTGSPSFLCDPREAGSRGCAPTDVPLGPRGMDSNRFVLPMPIFRQTWICRRNPTFIETKKISPL